MTTREFLRDDKSSVASWQEQVDQADIASARGWRRHSELGNLLRLDPERRGESITLHRKAVRLAQGLASARPAVVSRIRLAIALQYDGRHEDALRHFGIAEHTIRKHRVRGMRDFVEQHRGKCLVEMGRFEEARAALRRALRLRMDRREPSPDLVASTQRALAALDEIVASG